MTYRVIYPKKSNATGEEETLYQTHTELLTLIQGNNTRE